MPAFITGLGVCLPNQPVGNATIESVLGVVANRPSRLKDLVLMRNGINTRYYAIDPANERPTHTNAQLTAEAVRNLSQSCGRALQDIDLLTCGTSSPDQWIPNHAAMVQGELELPPLEILSASGVCCSGMAALKHAWLSLMAGTAREAVVTGSELASASLRSAHFQGQIDAQLEENPFLAFEHEFLRWMLSDGAGALWLAGEPRADGLSLRVDWLDVISYAGELETCMYAGALKNADGSLRTWRQESDWSELLREGYFNLAQDTTVLEKNILSVAFRRSLRQTRDKRKMTADQIDWLLPHLSSELFRAPIADILSTENFHIPQERWFTNLSTKGNTGAASIFIMLDELLYSGRLERGQRIICVVPESARFTFAYMQLTVV